MLEKRAATILQVNISQKCLRFSFKTKDYVSNLLLVFERPFVDLLKKTGKKITYNTKLYYLKTKTKERDLKKDS